MAIDTEHNHRGHTEPSDFSVSKFYSYKGPSYYLSRPALVFNLYIAPTGRTVEYYQPLIAAEFPVLATQSFERVIDLFVATLLETLRMDINLPIHDSSISFDGDSYVVAVQYLDEYIAEDAVILVADWFAALSNEEPFDFHTEFQRLQKRFDRTIQGGPTISSLIEAALKRNIPIFFLRNEGDFQWGYGKKQVRGRSTVFHTDSIKDTEFTTFKDAVKDFLLDCGFPTPIGRNCITEEELLEEVEELGFPLVVKPLAGHKGQGVTTDIQTKEEALTAFRRIIQAARESGTSFDGAIVEQQVYGKDHRLLAVDGRFVAALQRIPAYVEGNGKDTIETLIELENKRPERRDNARSPLAKIVIDEGLKDYIALQNLTLSSIPPVGERIYLRRVANVSAGGVSVNVTDAMHPKNIKMVNDIAKFFKVMCLGIDVLAEDISKPWDEGNFAIIEINAGPGVFMHIAPAEGSPIDVPGIIMRAHFPKDRSERIPIIAGNKISHDLSDRIYTALRALKPTLEYGALLHDGIYFNGEFFHCHRRHSKNVEIILRNPKLDFAVFRHTKDDIFDYGTFHQGADVVILEDPHYAEEILKRDVEPDGYILQVHDGYVVMMGKSLSEPRAVTFTAEEGRDGGIFKALEPLLPSLLTKYD
ncbi:MAG: cyanophycin synthetase [Bacteroidota bacterium]|nr:cyanophycin synthetase [Candidatus Kapabacteria bacterium]MDW8220409.1 cyanophycin synthetase [Bacteroidota bacterium]